MLTRILVYFCSMHHKKETRINKFLSESGYCSRREADKLIESGRVKINKNVASLGSKVYEEDRVTVDNQKIHKKRTKNTYLAFNKPKGIVCTTDTKREKNNIIEYINYPSRIFPIGRLDKASQGLILLTNDGDIVNKILRAKNKHEKEYEVIVDKPISENFLIKMSNGIPILNTVTRKCKIKKINNNKFNIILTQGLNRQIRRMCEYLGYQVKQLKRVRIMNIHLDIRSGEHRQLTKQELMRLNKMLTNSSKTAS